MRRWIHCAGLGIMVYVAQRAITSQLHTNV
jgi:hypothetical protein